MSTRPPFGATQVTTALLVVATLTTTFLPWARSGRRARNSFELVDVAGNAGVIPDNWHSIAPLWFLLPIVCSAALLALFTNFYRLPGILSTTIGLAVVSAGILVLRSPLVPLPGCRAAIVAGTVTILWGLALTARPQPIPSR